MRKTILSLFTLITLGSLTSCGVNTAVTANLNSNTTQVQLSNANFHVVDRITGSADVSYIFFIGGMSVHQLYENAYAKMMAKADLSKGARAVCNVLTEEQIEGVMPFYFTRTITVSANVIEFTK